MNRKPKHKYFKVSVERISRGSRTFLVVAENKNEARRAALHEAKRFDFSEFPVFDDGKFSVDSVVELKQNKKINKSK